MFHVKQFYFVVLFFTVFSSKGQGTLTIQDKPFVIDRTIDSSIWRQLKTSPLFQTLTEREQLMFYWTNYMRKDPKRFYNTIVKEFVRQFPEANSSEVKTLAKDVEEIKTELPFLMPDKGLLTMSKLHSKDLQSRGNTISHTSSKGKTFVERVREAGIYTCAAENVYIGNADPVQTLISLLVDYGVSGVGHRKNLLDSRFVGMGISFPSSKGNNGLLVQDFSCR